MDVTKASNAIVAAVDFYGSALAETKAENEQLREALRQAGESLRSAQRLLADKQAECERFEGKLRVVRARAFSPDGTSIERVREALAEDDRA